MEKDDDFITTAAEVLTIFTTDLDGAFDVITDDRTISDDARADLIRKFEAIGELLEEAKEIIGKESSEDE